MAAGSLTRGTSLIRALRWGPLPILAGSTLWLGAVSPSTVALAALALGLCLAAVRAEGRDGDRVALALLLLAGFTAVQCLPLPEALVEALSPTAATVWQDASALLGAVLRPRLSLDPEATRFDAVKWAGLAAVWSATIQLRRVMSLRRASLFVFGLALLAAAIFAAHRLLNAQRVYGSYERVSTVGELSAPLLNPNNLAGVLMLGAFAGAGFALHRRSTQAERALSGAGIAALCGCTVLTGSRGAALSLIAFALALLGWSWLHRRDDGGLERRFRWLLVGALGSVSFVALAASPSWAAQLWDDSLSKLELLRWALEVSRESPWTGTGRGAFGAEVGRFVDTPGDRVFSHAENWVADWITGWGWPMGALAVAGLCWLLRPSRCLRRNNATRAAIYCGLLALCLQNFVDLGFEVFAVMGLFVFLLAALEPHPAAEGQRRHSGHGAGSVRWTSPLVAGAALAGAAWLFVAPPDLAHHERRRLGAAWSGALQAPGGAADSLQQRARAVSEAVARHPGDAYLLRLGALVALEQQRPAVALQWLNASLRRDPNVGRTLLLLGQALHALGRTDQALTALRQASQRAPELAPEVARLATRWAPDKAREAVSTHDASALVELAAQTSDVARRLALLEEAIEHDPERIAARLARANAWLDAVVLRTAPCAVDPAACLAKVEAELGAVKPSTEHALGFDLLRARWLVAKGKHAEAYSWLSERCGPERRSDPCVTLLLDVATSLGAAEMKLAAERYLDLHCSTRCAQAQSFVGARYASRGDWALALDHHHRAAALSDSVDDWLAAAAAAARLGRVATTQRLLSRAEHAAAAAGGEAQARVRAARTALLGTAQAPPPLEAEGGPAAPHAPLTP